MKLQNRVGIKMLLGAVLMLFFTSNLFAQNKINVLVFSKTAAFHHQSIEAGKAAIAKMSKEQGFEAGLLKIPLSF